MSTADGIVVFQHLAWNNMHGAQHPSLHSRVIVQLATMVKLPQIL